MRRLSHGRLTGWGILQTASGCWPRRASRRISWSRSPYFVEPLPQQRHGGAVPVAGGNRLSVVPEQLILNVERTAGRAQSILGPMSEAVHRHLVRVCDPDVAKPLA